MSSTINYGLQNPGRLFAMERPAVHVDTDDSHLVVEVADFLRLVHKVRVTQRHAKLGGFWLFVSSQNINEPSLRVATWLYQVPVTLPDYC